MPRYYRDITNQKFGLLKALYPTTERKYGSIIWYCVCDCGNTCYTTSKFLVDGKTISCGCYRKQYGETSRLCVVWHNIKKRCYDPNDKDYKNYGALGISLCDEWLNYWNFKEWALSHGYADNLTINRLDNSKNYCPDNCNFVTKLEQAQNRRSSKPNPKSRIRNVQYCRDKGSKPWRASFKHNKKLHHVGNFETPELAQKALEEYKRLNNL